METVTATELHEKFVSLFFTDAKRINIKLVSQNHKANKSESQKSRRALDKFYSSMQMKPSEIKNARAFYEKYPTYPSTIGGALRQ